MAFTFSKGKAENSGRALLENFINSSPSISKTIYLDSVRYEAADVVKNYTRAAFPKETMFENRDTVHLSYFDSAYKEDFLRRHTKVLERYTPWAKKYIARENGMPDFHSIIRWPNNNPIHISFGYPKSQELQTYLKQDHSDLHISHRNTIAYFNLNYQEQENIISKALTENFSNLETAGGNKFILNRGEYPEDGIHIILNEDIFDGMYKSNLLNYREIHTGGNFLNIIFNRFTDAVPFVSGDKGPDGFILTDTNSNIESTYCFIWPYHKKDELERLALDCVMRSLGFPGYVEEQQSRLNTYSRGKEKGYSAYDLYLVELHNSECVYAGMEQNEFLKEIDAKLTCKLDEKEN